MLKAITASLLMEQVLAPNWKFKTKVSDDDKAKPGEIKIRGFLSIISTGCKDSHKMPVFLTFFPFGSKIYVFPQ